MIDATACSALAKLRAGAYGTGGLRVISSSRFHFKAQAWGASCSRRQTIVLVFRKKYGVAFMERMTSHLMSLGQRAGVSPKKRVSFAPSRARKLPVGRNRSRQRVRPAG